MRRAETSLEKLAKLSRQPASCIIRALVQRLSFGSLRIGRLHLLRLGGLPAIAGHMLRGPGRVRPAGPDDLARLATCGEDKTSQFLERFRSGDHCVVAEVDGKIVGYEWFSTRPSQVAAPFKYRIAIPPNSIYAYDAYILPAYRVSGLWLKFKAHLAVLMRDLNREFVITYVEDGNRLSMRSHERLGFRRVKSVVVSNLFG